MKLYVVATPIGNLKDISIRALEVLKEVDLILCEDTRVTRKLLDRYRIKTPVLSYHQHSKLQKTDYIINLLKEGKNLALVCDAGTPGISDPGNKLISLLVDKFKSGETLETYNGAEPKNLLTIIPIPGPSAITVAASISGFLMDKFLFLGFPPKKKGRKKFFEEIKNSNYPLMFFESPYRIIKTLEELKEKLGEREIMVGRELTKKFETIYRGKIKEVIKKIKGDKIKGEFIIVVNKKLR